MNALSCVRTRLRVLAENEACPAREWIREVLEAPDDEIAEDLRAFCHDLRLLAVKLDEILQEKAVRVSARAASPF